MDKKILIIIMLAFVTSIGAALYFSNQNFSNDNKETYLERENTERQEQEDTDENNLEEESIDKDNEIEEEEDLINDEENEEVQKQEVSRVEPAKQSIRSVIVPYTLSKIRVSVSEIQFYTCGDTNPDVKYKGFIGGANDTSTETFYILNPKDLIGIDVNMDTHINSYLQKLDSTGASNFGSPLFGRPCGGSPGNETVYFEDIDLEGFTKAKLYIGATSNHFYEPISNKIMTSMTILAGNENEILVIRFGINDIRDFMKSGKLSECAENEDFFIEDKQCLKEVVNEQLDIELVHDLRDSIIEQLEK